MPRWQNLHALLQIRDLSPTPKFSANPRPLLHRASGHVGPLRPRSSQPPVLLAHPQRPGLSRLLTRLLPKLLPPHFSRANELAQLQETQALRQRELHPRRASQASPGTAIPRTPRRHPCRDGCQQLQLLFQRRFARAEDEMICSSPSPAVPHPSPRSQSLHLRVPVVFHSKCWSIYSQVECPRQKRFLQLPIPAFASYLAPPCGMCPST
mmetsp:Transcript_73440/g.129603  ORF Transcript_73440/g.129603 Transcript_73440/m.129603 type:complete len:209 (-) Transcript_73440:248-874(-)